MPRSSDSARAAGRPAPSAGPRAGTWPRPADAAEERGPVAHAIFRISRKNRLMVADLLRPFGLFPGQELLLLQLPPGACCSQQALVDALGIDHSTVTKMLQRLERGGVVTREASTEDRRVVLVRLTEQGCGLRRSVTDLWADLEEATVGGLSANQRTQLLRLLRSVEAQLEP